MHVKGTIEDIISNTFYLKQNFTILNVKAKGVDIGYKMDKSAPYPAFDTVPKPVILDTKEKSVEMEYEGYIPEIIADINQIDEDIIELASYSGWFPEIRINEALFDFDMK